MRKLFFTISLFLIHYFILSQRIVFGVEQYLVGKTEIKNDLIFEDTTNINGRVFRIEKFEDIETSAQSIIPPPVYLEYFNKRGWFLNLRAHIFSFNCSFNTSTSDYLYGRLEQNGLKYTLVLGKEFLSRKKAHPFFSAGVSKYNFFNQGFDGSNYDFKKYNTWLKDNFSSFFNAALLLGVNLGPSGLFVRIDRNVVPINNKITSYTDIYCGIKFNFLGITPTKRIPLPKSELETFIYEKAVIPKANIGVSFEQPLHGGLELAKDTVTAFYSAEVDLEKENISNTFDDAYVHVDEFFLIEIRKRGRLRVYSPTITLYCENTISKSKKWYLRNALSFRHLSLKYDNVVKEYLTSETHLLSNSLDKTDLYENIASLKNSYTSILEDHKIGYRFIREKSPNYITIEVGIRINWTLRHWNNFTAKVRDVLPGINAGVSYKIKRFSFGINAERSIVVPDKESYYNYFYSINSHMSFDLYRIKK